MAQHAVNYISRPLAYIINLSISRGLFPDAVKSARITPVFKKGSPLTVGNYRPISILPIFSKIFENLVNKQLVSFLEKYDILLETQYGFRKKHSTKLALADLVSDISDKLDDGYTTLGIFIDLKKAFDTIDHGILLRKLEHYGVRGLPLSWFKSYLHNRQQSVVIDGISSHPRHVQCGVPQGSILGPTLFLIYINDIVNSTNFFNFRLFADDTSLFKSTTSQNINLNTINAKLNLVNDWCKANKLTINVEKTNYMIIKTPKRRVTIDGHLSIDNTQLNDVSCAGYLGVLMDSTLSWKFHINKVIKTITPKIGILSRIRHYVPRSTLILLYNTLILPHLTYCIEIWGNTYTSYLEPILKLQKRIARLITFSDFSAHSKPLFHQLKILDIHNLCKLSTCTFVFDLKQNRYSHDITKFIQPLSHDYPTRQVLAGNISIPKQNLTLSQNQITFSAAKHWNSLPSSIKQVTSRYVFKKQLTQNLLNSLAGQTI